jgi:hypothetical protein
MIKRKEGMCVKDDREYLEAENSAYDKLVKYGYIPQGGTKDFKKVVIVKIENENRNNEKREWFYFYNWQEAMETLCS